MLRAVIAIGCAAQSLAFAQPQERTKIAWFAETIRPRALADCPPGARGVVNFNPGAGWPWRSFCQPPMPPARRETGRKASPAGHPHAGAAPSAQASPRP